MSTEHRTYQTALGQPQEAQLEQLQTILGANQACAYGRQFGFASIATAKAYRHRVPVVDYDQLAPMIERMCAGENSLLCQEPLACFETTGGSSAGARMIPYTESSLAAMQRALYPWLMDLSIHRPGITRGSSYWSISPALRKRQITTGGVPIGMPNDAVYFGNTVASYLEGLLAVPALLGACRKLDTWRYLTLRYLINSRKLSLISVWSPSFLLDLLAYLDEHLARFVDDIEKGELSIDTSDLPATLDAAEFDANPTLADHLRASVQAGQVNAGYLWPQLDTLSCWTDGSADLFVAELRQRFPDVHLQGKGLLATEAFISLPMTGAAAPVLALRSGFYEFEDDAGRIHLCTELETGKSYAVIVTNHGGLYRYRLGDRVRCIGYFRKTPMLRFIGRVGLVSDLCGEKLSEDFVLRQLGRTRGFTTLLGSSYPQRRYVLVLDDSRWSPTEASEYAARVDLDLQRNPQYQYARSIDQLSALVPLRVKSPWRHFADYCHLQHRQQGDIKPPALSLDPKLLDYFVSRAGEPPAINA
jgi:hypothetical protein